MIRFFSNVSYCIAVCAGIAACFIMPLDDFGYTALVNDRELVVRVALFFLVLGAIVEFYNAIREGSK